MNDSETQREHFLKWHNQLQSLNIRGLVITDKESPLYHKLKTEQLKSELSTFSNVNCDESTASIKADHILGGEYQIIYFELTENSFDVNLFAAVSGTLVGGGLLFLIVDESITQYAQFLSATSHKNQTQQYRSRQSPQPQSPQPQSPQPQSPPENLCPLLDRVLQYSAGKASTSLICGNSFETFADLSSIGAGTKFEKVSALESQSHVITQIKRVANGHSKRPLVLTANRGRGKSAALGIAAAQLAAEKSILILVTAPNKSNLLTFYKHLNEQLVHDSINSKNKGNTISLANGSIIRFVPPDQLIENQSVEECKTKQLPRANLLLIDEAAAIPVGLLNELAHKFNRLVFSTTSHGYEGNGKGFEIRFKKRLLELRPQTQFADLSEPIRWSRSDQLEPATFNALLLNAKLETASPEKTKSQKQLSFESLSKDHLKQNESDLSSIFALLVNAHYQTRPADLQQLLSSPQLTVSVMRATSSAKTESDTIAAVALINQEGGLSSKTCQQLSDRKGRIKGELLPQSIVSHFGLLEAGSKKYLRVMRIAVHPEYQRLGIGSLLLSQIKDSAKTKQIDFIGASFAATNDVVNFWLKNHYQCIRFGSSKDSSSGSHSLEVLMALNTTATDILSQLTHRFSRAFIYKLRAELSDLCEEVVSQIIIQQLSFPTPELTTYELNELQQFANGRRSFSMVDDLVVKIFQAKKITINNHNILSSREWYFLVGCIFKQYNWQTLAEKFSFTGKKQAQTFLREIILKLVLA